MGTWNATSFGNDEALDLLLRLESKKSPQRLLSELRRCFKRYAEFELKRSSGTNVLVMTEAYVNSLLSQLDPDYLDDDFIARFRSRIGDLSVDDGSHEANAAIAASEILFACVTRKFDRIHEDGQFLARSRMKPSLGDIQESCEILTAVLANTELVRTNSAMWRRNCKDLLVLLEGAKALAS